MPPLEDRVASLERRLRVVEDEKAILQTMYMYAHCLDYETTPDGFADCFTEDALWWSSVEGKYGGTQGGLRLEGRKAIATWFAERAMRMQARPEGRLNTKHNLVNPKIRLEGDTATAESYHLAVFEREDGPYIQAIARYTDKFVRCPDGRWRFQERHLGREGASIDSQARRVG